MIALLIVLAFIAWRLAKRLYAVRKFEQNNLWVVAAVDFVFLPAAAYGLGECVAKILGALERPEAQRIAREATELLIVAAVSFGIARLFEVWVLSQREDGKKTRLPQLSRSALYGGCLFVGLLVFLIINDYSPTELYVSTGALAALLAFAMQQTLGDLFRAFL